MSLNFFIIGILILYLPLSSATLGDDLRNTLGGAVSITLGNFTLSDVKFSFVGEFGKMKDIFSDDVDSTGVMRLCNNLTAILRGVPFVAVNRLVVSGVNSYFKFSNAAVKRVSFLDNGILHVEGKKST